jgi:outer membrane immunogenic protein
MKKVLLASVALVGLTAGAFAADLPSRRVAPAPYVAVPVFTWTGFYVGVNAGYGFSANDDNRNSVGQFVATPGSLSGPLGGYTGVVSNGFSGSNSNDGFVGGGQIGYNYQMGNWVIGIEADAQYADMNNTRRGQVVTLTPGVAGFVGASNANFGGIDWFGTVRGRVGYAWDRLLVYGTGGFAYGGADDNNNDGFGGFRGNNNDIRTGWTAGGGVEYAFTPNLTGKIEGLYVSLDRNASNGFIGTLGGVPVYTTAFGRRNNDTEFAVVRAGLNYKFSLF